MTRAVIDLNVYISATILPRGAPFDIIQVWRAGRISVVASTGMLTELEDKLRSPKLARYQLGEADIQAILTLTTSQADLVLVPQHEVDAATGDPEDDLALATARLGHAEYFVTGDRKLLQLGTYATATVVTPAMFLATVHSSDP